MSQSFRLSLLAACMFASVQGQWLDHPTARTPRLPNGKANLFAPAPTAHGKPDLSGVWQVEPVLGEIERTVGPVSAISVPGDDPGTFSKYFFNILADFKRGEEPFRPETAKLFQARMANPGKDAPPLCFPLGVPMGDLLGAPFKIVQTPELMIMMYEADNTHRQVHLDGRSLPSDPQPSWLGYSVGKWEGDWLVVDTVGFNDRNPLDAFGHPHSEALHVTEKFHRKDFGHMEVEVTLDDPKAYTKPFTIKFNELLIPDTDITEFFCENEKDLVHMSKQ
jgi:hypothetical protein